DAAGRSVTSCNTGDAVTFRLGYHAEERIDSPVFGLAVYTLEGIHVTGPNTREAGLEIDHIDGDGYVDLHVDPLLLLPGAYDLSVACTDSTISHPYDQRHRAFRFDVRPGVPHETYGGIISLGGRWSEHPSG